MTPSPNISTRISKDLFHLIPGLIRSECSDHRSPNVPISRFLRPSADVPSAVDPTPLTLLLITKAQPQFDSPFDRPVEAFFRVFSRSNHDLLECRRLKCRLLNRKCLVFKDLF